MQNALATGEPLLDRDPAELALPLICYDDDICRVLEISRTTLKRLRKNGAFPIPELPPLDRRHRYARADVLAYVGRRRPKR